MMSSVPIANLGSSNTPAGPFAKMVFASLKILEYLINDSLPISKIEASGMFSIVTSALSP